MYPLTYSNSIRCVAVYALYQIAYHLIFFSIFLYLKWSCQYYTCWFWVSFIAKLCQPISDHIWVRNPIEINVIGKFSLICLLWVEQTSGILIDSLLLQVRCLLHYWSLWLVPHIKRHCLLLLPVFVRLMQVWSFLFIYYI